MDLGDSCSGLLSRCCQLGNGLALVGSVAQSAKGLPTAWQHCQSSVLTLAWPKLDPAAPSNGGSKGHEAEPSFVPNIFRGKLQSYSFEIGLMRVRASQQTAKLWSLCLCLRRNESPFARAQNTVFWWHSKVIKPSASLLCVYTNKPVHM